MDRIEDLAGKLPDREVAERLGIDSAAVKAWRRDNGVGPYLQPPPGEDGESTTAARLHAVRDQLGTKPDHEIAELLGVPRGAVGTYRRKHGISAYTGYLFRSDTPGAPEPRRAATGRVSAAERLEGVRDQLGVRPDHEIAAQVGLTRGAVGNFRRKHGIPAYEGYLFQASDEGSADAPAPSRERRAGRPPPSEKRGRGRPSQLDAFAHLIGKESDAQVATRAGVTRAAVKAWRKRRGVPPAPDVQSGEPGAPSRIEAFVHLLGTLPDGEVAAIAGLSRETVTFHRRRRGVAPYRRGQGRRAPTTPAPKHTPTPTPPPTPAAPLEAAAPALARFVPRVYRVLAVGPDGPRDFLLGGHGLADACERGLHALEARSDGPWRIDRVAVVADALV